jgi:hypothetical protein
LTQGVRAKVDWGGKVAAECRGGSLGTSAERLEGGMAERAHAETGGVGLGSHAEAGGGAEGWGLSAAVVQGVLGQ